ncbi:hypothetical protein V492_00672 [Pseudogymnoascus sp. VKM F-4246]|nr:hypothetical protein V492_00672 [Pseudogymnoascus sp. VKM F-4246]
MTKIFGVAMEMEIPSAPLGFVTLGTTLFRPIYSTHPQHPGTQTWCCPEPLDLIDMCFYKKPKFSEDILGGTNASNISEDANANT